METAPITTVLILNNYLFIPHLLISVNNYVYLLIYMHVNVDV